MTDLPVLASHAHIGYDGATEYMHDHPGADAGHDHRHGHDTHPGQTHDHLLSQGSDGELVIDHDHGPTDCGHLGDDMGTVRTVIQHRGRTLTLCGPCGASIDWDGLNG